jgi:hypothetical protein
MAFFIGRRSRTMVAGMNEPNTTRDDAVRRASAADDDDQRPEPQAENEDPAPEEAGYGYGV